MDFSNSKVKYTMSMITDEHSTSYELGFNTGAHDVAESLPIDDTDEIEAMGIASWQRARRSMELDLVQFVTGYTEAWAMWLNGFI
jgi:hypothetical protein